MLTLQFLDQLSAILNPTLNSEVFSSPPAASLDKTSLEAIRLLIRSELIEALTLYRAELGILKSENEQLKSVIASQQEVLERMEVNKRALNLVIRGLPKVSSVAEDKIQVTTLVNNICKNDTSFK